MRRLFALLLGLLLAPFEASALTGAMADSADRFPFVVEIKLEDQLICSGTVLYPRIVVTAAHCLQQKVMWRGGQFYADDYLGPAGLSVSVIRHGRAEIYAVAEIAISPDWRALTQGGSEERFTHDLALVVTKEPMQVEAPPNPLGTTVRAAAPGLSPADPPIHQGILVAFGGESCTVGACEGAGIRRYRPVAIKETAYCFKPLRGRDFRFPLPVWCMDSGVMPGDSGGALLVEADDGQFHYVGVISAQKGLPPELSAVDSWRRSLAAALYPNLPFIQEKAKELGYVP